MSEANDAEKDGEVQERDATSSSEADGDDSIAPEAKSDGASSSEAASAPVRKKKKKRKKGGRRGRPAKPRPRGDDQESP